MEKRDNWNWRKSSYSGSNGGNCVEVGGQAGAILVRDTTNREGVMLPVPAPFRCDAVAHFGTVPPSVTLSEPPANAGNAIDATD